MRRPERHSAGHPNATRRVARALVCFAAAGLFTGCAPLVPVDVRRENQRLKEQIEADKNELAARQASLDELSRQLAIARGFTAEDLKKIFFPEKLVVDSLTGGQDYDDNPANGDDGVTVYVRPVDKEGDTLKVAGDLRVELFDLESPPADNRVGLYVIPADQIGKNWYGKLMTNHYAIKCPWQHGPPKHPEITVRVTFVDYLTRRVMTAQTVCQVRLPAAKQ